ncbi:hypothetical protein ACLOJK_035685 [Asimina triloba]
MEHPVRTPRCTRMIKSSLLIALSHSFFSHSFYSLPLPVPLLKIASFSLDSLSSNLRNFIPLFLPLLKKSHLSLHLSLSLSLSPSPDLRPSLRASDKMDVPEKLVRLRFHLIFAALGILLLAALFYLVPSFVSLLFYFWPLLLSTALFLAAVFLFHRISPPESDASSHLKAGEQLLDYVAGQPEVSPKIKDSEEEEEEEEEDKNPMKSE